MKLLQDTRSLGVLFATTLVGMVALRSGRVNIFKTIEKAALAPALPLILLIIEHTVMFSELSQKPTRVNKFIKSDAFSISVAVFSVFLATKDIELTVLVVLAYLLLLQILRNEDERKKTPLLGLKTFLD